MRLSMIVLLTALAALGPPGALAQEETSSRRSGYYGYESSTGRYDDTEAAPRGRGAHVLSRGGHERFAATGEGAKNRMFLADSHAGIPYYRYKKCEDCHAGAVRNTHTVHGNISCRQCHGPDPVASVNHFFSRLNPIRRHAYVCAKCHEGAGASFASFVVHEPAPFSEEAASEFKALSWVSWGMAGLMFAVFMIFIPHTALWLLRELISRRGKGGRP